MSDFTPAPAARAALPENVKARVMRELTPFETVTWADQPIPHRLAMKTIPIVLFGIPWTAFSIFWIAAASGALFPNAERPDDMGWLMILLPLFGLPFVLVGLGLLSSPFWAMRNARESAYVITNKRAILIEKDFGGMKILSFTPEQLREIERKEAPDGTGDVIFMRELIIGSKGARRVKITGFLAVPNAKKVETLLRAIGTAGNEFGEPAFSG